jgi:tRNA 2-thiocytidine biosynthesis protein TtcA
MTKLEQILINYINQANEKWNLFSKGERLVIGISGGKDSLACLKLLSHFDLDLTAVYIDFFNKHDNELELYCRNYTDYKHIISDALEGKLESKKVCFSCSRQRRRLLLETAESVNASKVILGHHKNDVVETLLLNQIYSREISTMSPKQELFNGSYHLIRPMYMIPEPMLVTYAKEQNIPSFDLRCDFERNTKRKYIKELLDQIQNNSPGIDIIDNIFSSMDHIKTEFLPKLS